MSTATIETVDQHAPAAPDHPLTPLTADEIRAVRRIVDAHGLLGGSVRFVYTALDEPHKDTVLAFRAGDPVVVLPQGARTTVRAIETADGPLQRADVGLSVSLRLADHLDVSRGDLIAAAEEVPEVTDTFEATVCWFHDRPLVAGDRLRLKHTTRVTPVLVESVTGTFDVNELSVTEAPQLRENDIGVVTLRTATPLAVDRYEADRITGSFVLIDDRTFATIAAGMVGPPRLHG